MSLGAVSRWLNRITGGKPGWSLCARWADTYGASCLACRLIGWALSEPDHCAEELAFYLTSPQPMEKSMELLSNWRDVLKRAWSVKLIVLAALLSGAEVAVPMLYEVLPIPSGTFAALSGFVAAAALLARVVAQKDLPE